MTSSGLEHSEDSREAVPSERQLLVLEAKLKAQLKLKNPDEKVVRPIREELRHHYVRIIVLDSERAARLGVETQLWKLCFYKKIDEFRRTQARSSEQLRDPAKCAAAEQVLAAATREFRKFLDRSTALYVALLQKAALTCSLFLPGYGREPDAAWPACLEVQVDPASVSTPQRQALVATCYRCLIFLGDLERYRGTCVHDFTSYDWTSAQQHYSSAASLRPHAGNPHNQCGVISNYHNDDLGGFYHYSRSILCHEPYVPQGRANLEMILRKNRDAMPVDAVSNSQQRRRISQDPILRALLFGRWFVRPLGLLCLLSNLEHEALAEEEALSRLPGLLDADRHPSETCLRMVCACIFTVSDLERQLQEAEDHMAGSDENKTGNSLPDSAQLRDAYHRALDFTFRVALVLMRSAKAVHHHLQAVSVVCVWLLQHDHLVAPQKNIDRVRYDCERLQRSQESFVEGLVDLLNLTNPQRKSNFVEAVAAFDVMAGGDALPEDVLLVGWTPLKDCFNLLYTRGQGNELPGVMLGVKTVREKGELKKRRLERIMALAMVLSQAPGLLLCQNASGELSVEGRARSRQRSKNIVAVASSQPLPQVQSTHGALVKPARQAPGLVHVHTEKSSDQDVTSAALQSSDTICGECKTVGQAGHVDEFDGLFYCNACWVNLDALDTEKEHSGEHAEPAAYEGGEVAFNFRESTAEGAEGFVDYVDDEGGWDEDEEAFGSDSLSVYGSGLAAGLGDLAQQTALFAAAIHQPILPLNESAGYVVGKEGIVPWRANDELNNEDNAPKKGEQIGCGQTAIEGDDGMDDDEDIVFQPRSQATHGGHVRGGNAGINFMDAKINSPMDARTNLSGDLMANLGTSFVPAQSSLWGGFGAGPHGFGFSGPESMVRPSGSGGDWGQDGSAGIQKTELVASRFATRNPFAN